MMSLNFKEINLVLAELDLVGARIQKILQPSYDTIVLETFGPKGKKDLLISVSPGACRIHSISELPAKNERPLRFMECLKSRIRGGRIDALEQLSTDRIVKMSISMPESAENGDPGEAPVDRGKTSKGRPRAPSRSYTLYARLWSGAGNILLVDEGNCIVDALYRKPERGESSGLPCRIEELVQTSDSAEKAAAAAKFKVRDLEGQGSFSERIAAYYGAKAGVLSREALLLRASERFERKMQALEARESELERLLVEYEGSDRCRQIGDILMAGDFSQAAPADGRPTLPHFVEALDFYNDKLVSIQVDPSLGAVENAQLYYEKARKAASGLEDLRRELAKIETAKAEQRGWLAKIEAEMDPFAMAKALERAGTVRESSARKYPCICIERNGWTMLVGRSAKENDELLRRHVRGSDLWLHARDHSGSYVFIKARRDKSFPLEVMLDAGCLAIYYSKARKNMEGNVYYTQAKYLRRVKDGPKGLVVPALEKNLFVRLDESRVQELLACSSGGE
jgi:predicted ribosome quality control (RQC) complex YloA/Tae2 family protein